MKHEFFEKAKENLASAEICFENDLFNACANRAYYAAFQAAVSALTDRRIKRERIDYKWVQAEFSGKLIRRKKVYPGKIKSYLADMQTVRNETDYEVQNVTEKMARKQLGRAREIIMPVRKELQK